MKEPSKKAVYVTDHAVLRYMERHYGFNMELVRDHIIGICAGAAAFGATCVRAEGLRFEIVDNRITTVLPDGLMPSETSQQRSRERMRG